MKENLFLFKINFLSLKDNFCDKEEFEESLEIVLVDISDIFRDIYFNMIRVGMFFKLVKRKKDFYYKENIELYNN